MNSRHRPVSLDKLNPLTMDGSPEDIALIRSGIAELEKRHGLWKAALEVFEKRAGISGATVATLNPEEREAPSPGNGQLILKRRLNPYPTEPTGKLTLVEGSWASIVYKILSQAKRPISYPELRAEVAKTDLGRDMKPNEKPYYAGIQRLKMHGHCVLYKGRLSTPDNLKKYLDDVASGRAQSLDDVPRFHSKWGDAIAVYLKSHGGWVRSRDITTHLAALPDFSGVKNVHSMVCSVLSNMKYRRGIVERMGTGKNARWRFVGVPSTNGAAHGNDDGSLFPSETVRAAKGSTSAARH